MNQHLGFIISYIRYGGKMIITGRDIVSNMLGRADLDLDSTDLFYRIFGLRGGIKSMASEFSGAAATDGWPTLSLDRGKIPENWTGISYCWSVDGPNSFYRFQSSVQSEFHDRPCAVFNRIDNGGSVIVFGFPLYFMQDDSAHSCVQMALKRLEMSVDNKAHQAPEGYNLEAVFPNPFNELVQIRYSLPREVVMKLEVRDISSRLVATLVDERQLAGVHQTIWNSHCAPSGLYLLRMEAEGRMITKKMTLIK